MRLFLRSLHVGTHCYQSHSVALPFLISHLLALRENLFTTVVPSEPNGLDVHISLRSPYSKRTTPSLPVRTTVSRTLCTRPRRDAQRQRFASYSALFSSIAITILSIRDLSIFDNHRSAMSCSVAPDAIFASAYAP